MQFAKLKKKFRIKKVIQFYNKMTKWRNFLYINVLPFYTKLHNYKYLNHLEACKISSSIWAIINWVA